MEHRGKFITRIVSGLIFLVLLNLPATVQAFTITGSIVNGRNPDDNFVTYVYVDIGTDFTGNLPGDIASVTVTGPGGSPTWTQDAAHNDLPFSGDRRMLQNNFPGSPAIGAYTFTVTANDSSVATATDDYATFRPIPIVDSTKCSPANGAVISSKTQIFSWQQVSYTGVTLHGEWNGSAWSRLTGSHPASMLVSGSTLYADFPGYGLCEWDGAVWSRIATTVPTGMIAGF